MDSTLADPASNAAQQPAYARNRHRSIKREVLVLVGICTHLGCRRSSARNWPPTSTARSYARVTARALTWLGASTAMSRRRPTWWCRRIATCPSASS